MGTVLTRQERERKIRYVQDMFREDLGKVRSRFVAETIFGMDISGSVRLTKIARALEEDVPLHATAKRLSRNLATEKLDKVVGDKVLELGAEAIEQDSLLVVATSQLRKKYAKSMEFIENLGPQTKKTNGDEQTFSTGYSLYAVLGCDPGSNSITPLAQVLWSRNVPDAPSKAEQIHSLVDRVRRATGGRGVVSWQCSGHDRDLLIPWTADPDCRYSAQLEGEFGQLIYKKKTMSLQELMRLRVRRYSYSVVIDKVIEDGVEQSDFVRFGFLPVRLPECPDRPLWLVFADSPKYKLYRAVLTTESMRPNRRVVQWVIEADHAASTAQQTLRLHWQSVDLDDVRIMGYRRLQNMAALILLQSYYAAKSAPESIRSKSRLQFKSGDGAVS